MKKTLKIVSILCLAVLLVSFFAACDNGQNGLSAYEIAVKNGFDGTEKEWLDSLTGETTVNQTINNFTFDGETANIAAAANVGLKSVVSVFANFTEISYGGGWFPTQQQTTATSAGAGVIFQIEDNGSAYIVTNYHVVYDADSITSDKISTDVSVYLYGMESEQYGIPATYVGGSMYYDIAVLKVENNDLLKQAVTNNTACAAQFADSEKIVVGQTTIAIGNPAASGISVTSGIVSVDTEYITMLAVDNKTQITYRAIRTDTAINSGNSGGGLFDATGKLIGVVNAKMNTSQAENIAYAIPSNLAKAVAENIIYNCEGTSCKTVMRPILGITSTIAEMRTEINSENGLIEKYQTIQVEKVETASLAQGKIEVGDVLVSVTVGGVETQITRLHHIAESLLGARVGETVTVKVLRGGEPVTVELTITENCLTAY